MVDVGLLDGSEFGGKALEAVSLRIRVSRFRWEEQTAQTGCR